MSKDSLRRAMPDLTREELKRLLSYDAESGEFIYLRSHGGKAVGTRAGTTRPDGRRQIVLNGKNYKEHRLAWLYMTGKWPSETIDHIDGDPGYNKFANLRDIPHAINVQNKRKPQSNNASGFLGVSRNRHDTAWMARVHVNNTTIRRGPFDTPEAAHAAYLEMKRQIHAGCTL